MKRTQAITTLQRRITDILGSAGLPTDITTAIDQEFTQAINEIDEEAPVKKARKPAKRRAAPAKKQSASSKRRKARR